MPTEGEISRRQNDPPRPLTEEEWGALERLSRAPEGLPAVSTYTIECVLGEAGWHWQKSRN
ncbi:MAG: hypothetical protein M3Q65_10910 [Chloroflexota bacterium]|nr:hypothetical protein [Chloroflexota bacterium]